MLACGVVIFAAAYFRREAIDAFVAFVAGAILGFIIDCFGVWKFRLWNYTRQPFLEGNYFFLVLPSWGVFSVVVNLSWRWIELSWRVSPLVIFPVMTFILFVGFEILNSKTKSWSYSALIPIWLVFIGWFPLVFIFHIIFPFGLKIYDTLLLLS